MAIGKSIRIYDLAREVKQDTKRVMEDLRREGADVSVASNSVSYDIAEKVRSKYFPKTEAAPKRAIKIIKAARVVEEAPAEADTAPVEVEAPVETKPVEKIVETPATVAEEDGTPATPQVKRLTKKPVTEPVAEAEGPAVKKGAKPKAEEGEPVFEVVPEVEETARPT